MKKFMIVFIFILSFHLTEAQLKVAQNGNVIIGSDNKTAIKYGNTATFTPASNYTMLNGDDGLFIESTSYGLCGGGIGIHESGTYVWNGGSDCILALMDIDNMYSNNIATVAFVEDETGRYITISDSTTKEQITPLTSALAKIKQINGKQYYFKINIIETDSNKSIPSNAKISRRRLQTGFLAQEVENTIPEAVITKKDGTKYLDYVAIIPYLTEAIKEQQTQIEEMRIELKSLKEKCSSKISLKSAQISDNESISNILSTDIAVLYQNTPNPFNQSTEIKYYLPSTTNNATLCIYNMTGTQLKQIKITTKGNGSITISASEYPAGIYLYALIADGKEIDVKRMILTK